MTDLEKFKEMLTKASVVFTEEPNTSDMMDGSYSNEAARGGYSITIEAGAGPNNDGYMGFATSFHFSNTGALLNVGIWE